METDKLIYGKSNLKRVVGVEVKDGSAEIFQQNEDGTITSVFVPHKYWLLSNRPLSKKFSRLDGDLHYKYGIQFSERVEWSKWRSIWKKYEDVYTIWNSKEAMLVKDGITYYRDLLPTDISVLSFDLETTGLNPLDKLGKVILISNTFRSLSGKFHRLFSIDEHESEEAMLIEWVKWVVGMDPSILLGHNIFGFDLNYLINRANILGIQLNLGRDGSTISQSDNPSSFRIDGSRDMEYKDVTCYGREFIDTMFLAYRHDAAEKKYENYGLKTIVRQEGLEKVNRTFYDAAQIRFKYKNPEEMKKIKEYCKDDADDALSLFDLMCPAYFYQCQSVPRSFQHLHQSATGALINGMLLRSYLQDKHSIPKADALVGLEGGISFAVPGVYRNLWKVDISSAYPSQILRFQLYDKLKDPRGNFYNLVKYFTEQRFYYKKMEKETGDKKWKGLNTAAKTLINSAYGTCSTNGINFNSPSVAAKITSETRNVIDMALRWASGQGKDYWMTVFKQITGNEDTEDDAA